MRLLSICTMFAFIMAGCVSMPAQEDASAPPGDAVLLHPTADERSCAVVEPDNCLPQFGDGNSREKHEKKCKTKDHKWKQTCDEEPLYYAFEEVMTDCSEVGLMRLISTENAQAMLPEPFVAQSFEETLVALGGTPFAVPPRPGSMTAIGWGSESCAEGTYSGPFIFVEHMDIVDVPAVDSNLNMYAPEGMGLLTEEWLEEFERQMNVVGVALTVDDWHHTPTPAGGLTGWTQSIEGDPLGSLEIDYYGEGAATVIYLRFWVPLDGGWIIGEEKRTDANITGGEVVECNFVEGNLMHDFMGACRDDDLGFVLPAWEAQWDVRYFPDFALVEA